MFYVYLVYPIYVFEALNPIFRYYEYIKNACVSNKNKCSLELRQFFYCYSKKTNYFL